MYKLNFFAIIADCCIEVKIFYRQNCLYLKQNEQKRILCNVFATLICYNKLMKQIYIGFTI